MMTDFTPSLNGPACPSRTHGAAGFDQQAPASAAQQEGRGNFHIVLIQPFFPVGIIKDPVLVLSEAGQDFALPTGKPQFGRAGHAKRVRVFPFRDHHLAVGGPAGCLRASGRVQTVHRALGTAEACLGQKQTGII